MNRQNSSVKREKCSGNRIIQIKDLSVIFPLRQGNLIAIDGVSLDIYEGETLGLVGESGCGKSTLGFSMLKSIQSPGRIISGEILFRNEDLLTKSEVELRRIRGKKISMIFQDPMTSLNPLMRIDKHIIETVKKHEGNISTRHARERAASLLDKLGILRGRLYDYPHQLSGGMRQRVMIGIGLSLNAEVIIADEPTTSLDVIVEAQFLDLLQQLKEEFDLTFILITHNMGIVAQITDRIAVMYGGRIVEVGETRALFAEPLHPYTEGLLKSVPNINLDDDQLVSMPGFPPNLLNPPKNCVFSPRCPYVFSRCMHEVPDVYNVENRKVCCFRYADD